MSWSFEISFLVFLVLIFISQAIATKTKHMIPMPLALGVLSLVGFYYEILPRDFIEKSNMIAVGTIAYNLLVINGGTMINIELIKKNLKQAVICLVSAFTIWIVIGLGLKDIVGHELALLSSGAVIGGGATVAIASYMMVATIPEIAVYPWLIFMFQGIFAVPIIRWALKKEVEVLLNEMPKVEDHTNPQADEFKKVRQGNKLYDKLSKDYKTTAYYLGLIMIINVINKWINNSFDFGINPNATALILGFIATQIGVLDIGPLHRSDSFGLLLLGLMGLMVNTLSKNPISNIIILLKPMFIVFVASIIVLLIVSVIFSKLYNLSVYGLIAMNLNCLMGFPVNQLLIDDAVTILTREEERKYIKGKLSPLLNLATMLIVNTISIIIISITVNII